MSPQQPAARHWPARSTILAAQAASAVTAESSGISEPAVVVRHGAVTVKSSPR
jgi:hypothetical protein